MSKEDDEDFASLLASQYDREFVAWLFNSDNVEYVQQDCDLLELASEAFLAGRAYAD